MPQRCVQSFTGLTPLSVDQWRVPVSAPRRLCRADSIHAKPSRPRWLMARPAGQAVPPTHSARPRSRSAIVVARASPLALPLVTRDAAIRASGTIRAI
jgi:hypothetical protein